MKTLITATIIFALLSSLVVGIQAVEDQSYLAITIKPDGSVEPDTNLLERNGTTYTFKSDIFGNIMVQKGSITIDGAGHTLQGRKEVDERGIYLVGPDRSRPSCRNVVVKNLRIYNFYDGIFAVGTSNISIIGNYLENAGIHLIGGANITGDLITNNTFRGSAIFVDYNRGGLDVITENNFFNSGILVDLADAPIVERNYWSDYNGKDSDGDGIGDTPFDPYITIEGSRFIHEGHEDNFPLMNPIDNQWYVPVEESEPFPLAIIAVIMGAIIGVISLLIYFKKRP